MLVSNLIRDKLGLKLSQVNIDALNKHFERRLIETKSSLTKFLSDLAGNHSTDTGEWQALVQCLTNNESFFFRDEGMYALLHSKILPELLEKNRESRRIRIWSAACSRGEEIYSIAMLLREMVDASEKWHFELYGTDINEKAIRIAREGNYSEWSLRAVKPENRERYFKKNKNEWKLSSDIRDMVKFEHVNLTSEVYPEFISDMDLVICRNVFIYFSPNSIESTVSNIHRSLRPGGLFLTGHAELNGINIKGLAVEMLPGSIVYRRSETRVVEPVLFISVDIPKLNHKPVQQKTKKQKNKVNYQVYRPSKLQQDNTKPHTYLENALALFFETRYQEALSSLESINQDDEEIYLNALKLQAQCWTNLGQYNKALPPLKQALALSPFSPDLYFLNAHIQELIGDRQAAISALEKSIYLDGEFIPAYIELASLLDSTGGNKRTKRLRSTAKNLLSNLPDDSQVMPYIDFKAAELADYLSEMVTGEVMIS